MAAFESVDFPTRDGDTEDSFPQDIDGDEVMHFVLQDDSFRYQFASGAGSWSPPVIYNIYRGNLVNVTTQPGYRPLSENSLLWLGRPVRTARMRTEMVPALHT